MPRSSEALSKRIRQISYDRRKHYLERILNSPKFEIKLEESTDISSLAQRIKYVHYYFENRVNEDILFCQPLDRKPTGDDISVKLKILPSR